MLDMNVDFSREKRSNGEGNKAHSKVIKTMRPCSNTSD